MKILMIRLRSIGDIVQCTPAFLAARKMFKNSSIDLMVEERFASLVVENPYIDGFLLYKKPAGGFLNQLGYDLKFLAMIRKRHYDLIIDFHGIPKTAWFSYLSGCRARVGYNYKGRGHLYTHRMQPPEKFKVHSAQNQIDLLRYAPDEFKNHPYPPDMREAGTFISAEFAGGETQKFLADNSISDGFNIFIYHISPSNDFKKWPASNYSALINMLEGHEALKNTRKAHVIIGTSKDMDEFENIKSKVVLHNGKLVSACGVLSLGAIYNLARSGVCYVGPDSGPLHVAAAAKINVIGLFGPTNVETFGPLSDSFTGVFRNDLACRPCDQKKCVTRDYRCINGIGVRQVFDAVLGAIKNKKSNL